MNRIRWSTNVNAPCCPGEIVRVGRPERDEETGRFIPAETYLPQPDFEYPSVARDFGWDMRSVQREGHSCHHESTDGTVTCRECGLTATDFISAAYDWLRENHGVTAEDPGYFA
jgi:hypothetical protein